MNVKGKRFIIYGVNFHPELTGIGKYTGEMVNWLTQHGAVCTVVTGYPYYPFWKVQKPFKNLTYTKEILQNNLTIYRCPIYVPAKPSGIKRIFLI